MKNISITNILQFFECEQDLSKFAYRFLFYLLSQKSCQLTNKELAEMYSVSNELIKKTITDLKKREMITVETVNNIRTIAPGERFVCYFDAKQQKPITGSSTTLTVISNSVTVENKTRVNGEMLNEREIAIKEVIDYLNLKTGKRFDYTKKNSNKHVIARLNEGYTVEQMKQAIDIKVPQWKGNQRFEKFLRPETLFGNKLEGYLNEQGTQTNNGVSSADLLRAFKEHKKGGEYNHDELSNI